MAYIVLIFSLILPRTNQQCMLWSSFTLSFYGFLCASECLSLTWSDITLAEDHVLVELHQSKTDPFRRGQSVHIFQPTNLVVIYLSSTGLKTICRPSGYQTFPLAGILCKRSHP